MTLLEIGPPEAGGIREQALSGDRSASPPPPLQAPRLWDLSLARRAAYLLGAVVLALLILVPLFGVVRLG